MTISSSPNGSRLSSTGDILMGAGGFLLFVDSFWNWERLCVTIVRVAPICVPYWTAWSGRGALVGAGMAVASGLLFGWQTMRLASRRVELPAVLANAVRADEARNGWTIALGLAALTVALGGVKIAAVLADHTWYGSYVGFVVLAVITLGGAMRLMATRMRRRAT
ncbi:MAG TPA: hypothetical protein VF660_10370 [Actinomycetota bacterium]